MIRRDTYGVPHILAKTEEAAAFGLGYAHAEDHCVTIARRLVAARGEMAKYFGQGVESDFMMKQFDNLEVCRTNFGQMDPLLQWRLALRLAKMFTGPTEIKSVTQLCKRASD